jgi:hypothetical protein
MVYLSAIPSTLSMEDISLLCPFLPTIDTFGSTLLQPMPLVITHPKAQNNKLGGSNATIQQYKISGYKHMKHSSDTTNFIHVSIGLKHPYKVHSQ